MGNLTYLVHSVLSKEELDKRKYAFPEERKFPMPDKKHVLSAIKFFNYVSPSEEKTLAKAILARMKEYGMTDVNVGPDNRFSKYYKKGDDMSKTYLVHAKGQEWDHHRYIRKEGNRYIYPEDIKKGNKNASPSTPRTQARQMFKEDRSTNYRAAAIRERQANATAQKEAREAAEAKANDRRRILENNQLMRAGREEMRVNQDAERVEASRPQTPAPTTRPNANNNGRIEEARNEALIAARRVKDVKELTDIVNGFFDNLSRLASVGGNSNIDGLINSGRQFIAGLINSRMQAGAKPRSDERTNNHGANLQSLRNRRTHAYG